MEVSFLLGLGFLLLLFLLTGLMLVGSEGRLLFVGITLGFAGTILVLFFATSP